MACGNTFQALFPHHHHPPRAALCGSLSSFRSNSCNATEHLPAGGTRQYYHSCSVTRSSAIRTAVPAACSIEGSCSITGRIPIRAAVHATPSSYGSCSIPSAVPLNGNKRWVLAVVDAVEPPAVIYRHLPLHPHLLRLRPARPLSWNLAWISYDDMRAVAVKVEYARGLGLDGYFCWALGFDMNWTLSRIVYYFLNVILLP